jgi:hypothetical protein
MTERTILGLVFENRYWHENDHAQAGGFSVLPMPVGLVPKTGRQVMRTPESMPGPSLMPLAISATPLTTSSNLSSWTNSREPDRRAGALQSAVPRPRLGFVLGDGVQEFQCRRGRGPAPGQQGRVEPAARGLSGLDGPGDRF